jgi:serine phosphatase RsbU (regulator of sigma subunit)
MSNPEDEGTILISRTRHGEAALPADTLAHYLVVIGGNDLGKLIEIGQMPMTIGRDAKQAIVLVDTEVSRLHARVSLLAGEPVVEDLKSTNGTFVDSERIREPMVLREGNVLRIGKQLLKYERRSRRDVERKQELDRDLVRASGYVLALLPAPLDSGAVRTDWKFMPSVQLGGDAFGYHWLDANTFALYLVDVSGHGVGAAMHTVTLLNLLRQRALPGVDFQNPPEVLASLNDRFQMESHSGMFFTMWYGVYRTDTRQVRYGSAGHHPAYVVPADRSATMPLGIPALMIGAIPGAEYGSAEATIAPGSRLYLFSDGVFEVVTKDQKRWAIEDFLPLLLQPPSPGLSESDRLFRAVTDATGSESFEDDFSLLVVTFP